MRSLIELLRADRASRHPSTTEPRSAGAMVIQPQSTPTPVADWNPGALETPVNPPKEAAKHQLFVPSEDSHKDSAPATTAAVVPDPTQEQIDKAGRILAQAGVRLVGRAHGVDYAGVWSDLDGPEVRAAIAVFHPDGVPVRYLDSGGIPMRFKLRRVPGEPVPANVLAAMEREPDEPWKVRDRCWRK